MTRNYGLGNRDMARAGQIALKAAAARGALSFASAATLAKRWGQFAPWAKDAGIKKMEQIDRECVVTYGCELADLVHNGDMAASTAQNYLSAINTVMQLATLHAGVPVWKSVSPTKDAQIPQRNGIATVSRAISHQEHQCLGSAVTERIAALLNLQRSLGLRFEESAKLDARKALQQAMRENQVNISAGTKGGRSRTVPVSPEARQALEHAATIQARDRSMIPAHQTYAAFQRAAYREMINADGGGFHGERHWYAQERYQQLTGAPCPVAVGWSRSERFERLAQRLGVSPDTARQIDEIARLDIARELGHSRVGVTNAYLG